MSMKINTAAKAMPMDRAPLKMVSSPSVAPIVFSLTGCDFSVAGKAPARGCGTRSSMAFCVKSPVIWPWLLMIALSVGAERTWPSRMMASRRLKEVFASEPVG